MSRICAKCPAWMPRLSAILSVAALAASPIQAQPAAAETLRVQSMQVMPTISVGGTVVPHKEVTLAAQLPGSVEYVAGREGERFPEGALLVVLNDDELLARRRNAEAQLRNAEADLRNAGVQ